MPWNKVPVKLSNINPVAFRIYPELKAEIARRANANGRSMNAEIIHLIEVGIDHEQVAETFKKQADDAGPGLDGPPRHLLTRVI